MSIAAATGGTGPPLARSEQRALCERTVSALALAPVPVAAIWFGFPWLPIVTAAAAAVMAWEWARLSRYGHFGRVGMVLVGAVLAPLATTAVGAPRAAIGVALMGTGAVLWVARRRRDAAPLWTAFGALWVSLPCVAFLWLARAYPMGRATLLWILATVWATDIGAYAIGRALGGPRLAPRWSPRKTWAGLAGGTVSAALAGWATAAWLGLSPRLPLVVVSSALAIVEQFGDLAESLAKRRFGVKDSSGLIPGHGGLLDRLDGMLAVVPTVALLTLIGGRSVLAWR
jgi:phosphatidate cytidylyltransferase